MVFDAYSGRVMTNPIFMWIADDEQSEIEVFWSRWNPVESDPYRAPAAERSGNKMSIRPRLEGCSSIEVYVNGPTSTLRAGERALQFWAIEGDAPIIPDDRFPSCSVLFTYRRLESPEKFVLTAATRDGVVAEFENGRRKPAWLLLMPPAITADATATALAVVGAVVLAYAALLAS